jgi:hypothetical protein
MTQCAWLLRASGALHLAIFDQPVKEPEQSENVSPREEFCSIRAGNSPETFHLRFTPGIE